jgi:hypothetical protein
MMPAEAAAPLLTILGKLVVEFIVTDGAFHLGIPPVDATVAGASTPSPPVTVAFGGAWPGESLSGREREKEPPAGESG